MSYCGNCGTELPETASFCQECGSKIDNVKDSRPPVILKKSLKKDKPLKKVFSAPSVVCCGLNLLIWLTLLIPTVFSLLFNLLAKSLNYTLSNWLGKIQCYNEIIIETNICLVLAVIFPIINIVYFIVMLCNMQKIRKHFPLQWAIIAIGIFILGGSYFSGYRLITITGNEIETAGSTLGESTDELIDNIFHFEETDESENNRVLESVLGFLGIRSDSINHKVGTSIQSTEKLLQEYLNTGYFVPAAIIMICVAGELLCILLWGKKCALRQAERETLMSNLRKEK